MKVLSRILAVSTLAVTLTGGVILAQDRPNDQHAQQHQKYMRHNEWKKGAHIKTEKDWGRASRSIGMPHDPQTAAQGLRMA